jgi:hypothetical protein
MLMDHVLESDLIATYIIRSILEINKIKTSHSSLRRLNRKQHLIDYGDVLLINKTNGE